MMLRRVLRKSRKKHGTPSTHFYSLDTSIHSKAKRKPSTCTKKNLFLEKSQHSFNESNSVTPVNKSSRKISVTTAPTPLRQLNLSANEENLPNRKSKGQKRERRKKSPVLQVSLVRLEDENSQSSVGRILRSRCNTSIRENLHNLKEKRMAQRQDKQSQTPKISVTKSSSSISSKRGRKASTCKRINMPQDKCEQNHEESFFQKDVLDGTSVVTSTPLVSNHRKAKTLKNKNARGRRFSKRISSKGKFKSFPDLQFQTPNIPATSLKDDLARVRTRQYSISPKKTCNNSAKQIKNIKHTQKPSTKQKTKVNKVSRHTFSEYPIDDLSLSKAAMNKRKVKSEGHKVPNKNTLKRKRYVFNEFHKANEGYEDDIYESQEFDCFKDLLQDSDMSFSDVSSMPTPKFGLLITPKVFPKTPVFKDCISSEEYAENRKIAEQCMYRTLKRKKNVSHEEAPVPEKKKLEFNEVLENIQRQEKAIEKIFEDSRSDNENSDISD